MNALGGRGIYPIDLRFPGGTRLLVGGGAGVAEGGNSFDDSSDGSGESGDAGSGSQ